MLVVRLNHEDLSYSTISDSQILSFFTYVLCLYEINDIGFILNTPMKF